MSSVNRVFLIGRVGRDPELRYTQGGAAVCNFSLATDETWKDKQGVKQEKVEWHKLVCWGKTGELCGQYVKKGSLIYVEGRIQTRDWVDKSDNKRQTTEINCSSVQFLDSKGEKAEQSPDKGFPPPTPDSEVPF